MARSADATTVDCGFVPPEAKPNKKSDESSSTPNVAAIRRNRRMISPSVPLEANRRDLPLGPPLLATRFASPYAGPSASGESSNEAPTIAPHPKAKSKIDEKQ